MRIDDSHIGIMNFIKEESKASSGRIKYSSEGTKVFSEKNTDLFNDSMISDGTKITFDEIFEGIRATPKESLNINPENYDLTSDDEAIDFKKAVDDYRSEYLTGMTEEEWNEFYEKCKQYLKENPINSKADAAAYTSFMKSLLQEYGFKGNINDMTSFLGIDESNLPSLEYSNASVELKPSRTQIITERDGTRYLIITTNSNQTIKIQIGSNTDSQNKSEQAVKAYERSFLLLED